MLLFEQKNDSKEIVTIVLDFFTAPRWSSETRIADEFAYEQQDDSTNLGCDKIQTKTCFGSNVPEFYYPGMFLNFDPTDGQKYTRCESLGFDEDLPPIY